MTKIVFLAALLPVWALAQEGGHFEGIVTNRATGNGIASVSVSLRARDGQILSATTDNSGRFRYAGLPNGNYVASFDKLGYLPTVEMFPYVVHIQGAGTVRHDIELTPWAEVRGRVLDPNGQPAVRVRVQLRPMTTEVLTDESGLFVFDKVKPGYYKVLAKPEPKTRLLDGQRIATQETYYPSAIESGVGVRVLVRSATAPPFLEIQLRTSAVHRVNGLVLDNLGKPAAKATIKLLTIADRESQEFSSGMNPSGSYVTLGPARARECYRVESREDGTFVFDAVRPGLWRVQAESFPYEEPVRGRTLVLSGGDTVNVSDDDVADLEIRLASSFDLAWVSDAPLSILLAPLDGQQGPSILPPEKTSKFFEDVLPGRYRVAAIQPPGGSTYVSSVLLDGRDVLGQDVNLTPGMGPLRILHSEAGKFSGSIENGNGAMVVLYPALSEDNRLSYIWAVRCDSTGHFELSGIVPGSYYALAFSSLDFTMLPMLRFVGGTVVAAQQIRIAGGTAVISELKIVPWPW